MTNPSGRVDAFGSVVDMSPRDVDITEPGVLGVRLLDGEACGVQFICPCGCGRHVWIPVATPKDQNRWGFERQGDAVTLTPSILDRGCGAHYFIRSNRVVWV